MAGGWIVSVHRFNPRPPCGERPQIDRKLIKAGLFQSTPPVWGATDLLPAASPIQNVSIHAPRVGSDRRVG